jgi:BlaI family transcriptional regulator, penicillinase repressor
MQLTKAEEELMEIIWQHEKVFMKELLESYPDPKPATTTLATLLKRMQDKGFVGYTVFGNSRQYHALVNKTDYFSKQVKGLIKNFFNNSPLQFASFFTTATNLSKAELEDLKKIVEQQIQKRKK